MVTVLTDGPFRIDWNGGHTYNIFALDKEVNVFSSDYGTQETEDQARKHAREWWMDGGKESTQEVIRNTA